MEFTEYTSVKNKFHKAPTLCELFKLLSIETWKRIEYAYIKPGVKIYETTITQNLIFSINAFKDQYGLNVEIYEAIDEQTNGNDLELIIRFPENNLEFYVPIQAKKINKQGKYASLDHGKQIELLLQYGKSKLATPLYLFYNYNGVSSGSNELSGCTLIPASHLFRNHYRKKLKRNGTWGWEIPYFTDLYPKFAFQWHELVCPTSAKDMLNVLKKNRIANKNIRHLNDLLPVSRESHLGFYPLETEYDTKDWVNINDLSRSRDVPMRNEYFLTSDDDDNRQEINPEFSPSTRIVISN